VKGWLDLELVRPEAAPWVLPVALVLALVGALGLVLRRRARARLVAPARRRAFLPGYSRARAAGRVAIATAGALFLGFSYLGPVRGWTEREVEQRGLDLVVCVDSSRSMLARDLRPNRLERAVREVRGLLDYLVGDRVALIAFSGDAREVAPLTHDRTTLAALLGEVDPDANRRGGTELGVAIDRAAEMFDERTGADRVIVLITDGGDLGGEGLAAAERAAEEDIRVFVVGVGTRGGGKIPDATGTFVRDPEGGEVVTRLEEESLIALAEVSGGAYRSTSMSPTPLEDLYTDHIAALEGRALAESVVRIPHDRFQWTLGLALALMLLEAGLRERRPGRQGPSRREAGRAA
jgi:Ca-activated chloride channel family protein